MKRAKTFDCVQMKWDIQRKLAEEMAGRSPDEIARLAWDRAARDPILGPFLRCAGASATEGPDADSRARTSSG